MRSLPVIFLAWLLLSGAPPARTLAQSQPSTRPDRDASAIEAAFRTTVQPLLQEHCIRCHNADNAESGIRLDRLDGTLEDQHLRLWQGVHKQVNEGAMPPEDEVQPSEAQRHMLSEWIGDALHMARSRPVASNGSVRRLTVPQYRNTIKDLLGLEEDLTDVLPPDAVSKEGFTNNSNSMLLSPLQVEAYFSIAEKALDLCIVDESTTPTIQNFRMDLGKGVNPQPCPDNLILGANNHLLANDDFVVRQPEPSKPFEFLPLRMRTQYRFNEGYEGNSTVRGWRDYDSIYHAVFACMRGNPGYPKGRAYETIPEGLLLRPAIPSAELFGVDSTYGPKANFKISLRELPDHGNFRVTVTAAKYNDGLLLDPGTAAQEESVPVAITVTELSETQSVMIDTAAIYQIDVHLKPADASVELDSSRPGGRLISDASVDDGTLHRISGNRESVGTLTGGATIGESPSRREPQDLVLQLGDRHFSGTLHGPAFLAVRLPRGNIALHADYAGQPVPDRIVLTPLPETHDIRRQFTAFEARAPRVGVHVGLRRDCGSTFSRVGRPLTVSGSQPDQFVFEGAINNFPSPDVQEDNDNYLAGVREIGVRSEYTDGRDMPRLLIRSVEFEGPLYDTWPPRTHQRIFIASEFEAPSEAYASEIIASFASRAFRRPIRAEELASLLTIWRESLAVTGDFQRSVKDALLVVLTSPQFLFLIENSTTPEPESLESHELASKLSYFLWNAPPDGQLLTLAGSGELHQSLDAEIDRLIEDARFEQFAHEFGSQWLSLDKLDVVEVDLSRYPRLSRDTRAALREEPVLYLQYVIRHNLPVRNLIQSEFLLANEIVADYYDLADQPDTGFEFVPIQHQNANLGGLLTQAGILAGLSDGRESNPVKRGAWLARKIIAEPPDDPPPNVPALNEDTSHLSLRERLERHRNQKGCVKCHEGIDPWGVPFEQFDAGGLFRQKAVDARSTLPDDTEVVGVNELKAYLAEDRVDQVAFSVLKHLATYAIGRSLTYNEIEFLKGGALDLKADGYRMKEMIRFVVTSDLFLKK